MDEEERQFPSEEPDEQHTEEQGSYRERAEEELEKKPLGEDAGLGPFGASTLISAYTSDASQERVSDREARGKKGGL